MIVLGDIVVSGLGCENSKMMRYLFELQLQSIRLYMFLKKFLPRYNHKLDGYLLKLLVIFYLQNEKLLPSIEAVQRDVPQQILNGKKRIIF